MANVAVIGSGPNGLAAAVTLARAGCSVVVYEKADTAGGGARTAELTLPGYLHDVCSAVHPMAVASPFFRRFELERRVQMVYGEASYAQPLPDGRVAVVYPDVARTAAGLDRDGARWRRIFGPLVERIDSVVQLSSGRLDHPPLDPVALAAFGATVLTQGTTMWNTGWRGESAPALLTGVTAHIPSNLPSLAAASGGIVLAVHAQACGWPVPVGGSAQIIRAMLADLRAHDGRLLTRHEVRSFDEVLPADAVLFDTTPHAMLSILKHRAPDGYARSLRRFRYGSGVSKIDVAMSEPIPWKNPRMAQAATWHLGGTRRSIAHAENQVHRGLIPDRPFVVAAQPSAVDLTRAPEGRHVLWAYTHVPAGCPVDMREAMLSRIEEYAPGFRDCILEVRSTTAPEYARENPNYVGGDIAAGAVTLRQLVARPVFSPTPWKTPVPGVYLCSASTAPGPGVHGQCGYQAALQVLKNEFGICQAPELGISEG